jgi:copper chaperone CopZ
MFWSREKGKEFTLIVESMHCTNCESSVKIALHKISGVKKIKVRKRKRVMVETDPDHPVARTELISTIQRMGYHVIDDADA